MENKGYADFEEAKKVYCGNVEMANNKTKNSFELKHCQTQSSYKIFYLMQQEPKKERSFLILEYDYVTRKPRIEP